MTPAVMAPLLGVEVFDDSGSAPGETVDVGRAVWVIVEPDWVIVKVGGFPVAIGPAVAGPAAGVVAVAPPWDEPPMTDCTKAGTL
jgi:hypothetical protein